MHMQHMTWRRSLMLWHHGMVRGRPSQEQQGFISLPNSALFQS